METKIALFPDTGGYGRLNIYAVSPQLVLVRGSFEELLVHTESLQIEKIQQPERATGTYLAAFARSPEGDWRFIPASEAGEVNVTPAQ